MRFSRPRSLNGLILVGFCLVALPLLVAVVWALVNLDRVSRQYLVLRNEDSLALLQQDLGALEGTLDTMAALTQQADAVSLARAIRVSARRLGKGAV